MVERPRWTATCIRLCSCLHLCATLITKVISGADLTKPLPLVKGALRTVRCVRLRIFVDCVGAFFTLPNIHRHALSPVPHKIDLAECMSGKPCTSTTVPEWWCHYISQSETHNLFVTSGHVGRKRHRPNANHFRQRMGHHNISFRHFRQRNSPCGLENSG